jgi:hypothetical protein
MINDFRLYYDSNGDVIEYSMTSLDGVYLQIDALTFAERRYDVKVIDGQIIRLHELNQLKLHEVTENGIACHSTDISIVVDSEYTDKKLWAYKRASK